MADYQNKNTDFFKIRFFTIKLETPQPLQP